MPDDILSNEQAYLAEIVTAKEKLDSAYNQFIDGAITVVELQQWVINLSFCVNNYSIFANNALYNKD